MSARKRSNEHGHLSKEEYDALQFNEQGSQENGNDDGGSFERATDVQNRRIVKVSRRPPIAPPPRAAADAAVAVNPFASVNLMNTTGTSGAAVAAVVRSAVGPIAARPFSFVGTSVSAVAAVSAATAAVPRTSFDSERARVHQSFLAQIAKLQATAPCSNWSRVNERFVTHIEMLQIERNNNENNNNNNENNNKSSNSSSNAQNPRGVGAAVAAAAPAAPAAAIVKFGIVAPAQAPNMSFPSTTTTATAHTSGGNNADDDAVDASNNNNDEGNDGDNENATTGFQQVSDPDWNDVQEFGKVRMYRLEQLQPPDQPTQSWVSFCSGNVRLQTKKTDAKKARMVLRDEAGKVHVNMLIDPQSSNFVLTQQQQQAAPPKNMGKIQFKGVNDEKRGYEAFVIKGRWELSQALHAKLVELVQLAG